MDKLMLKYLNRCYPIVRLKNGKHFKMGIIYNNQPFLISNKNNLKDCFNLLKTELILVFDEKSTSAERVLYKYLHISKYI